MIDEVVYRRLVTKFTISDDCWEWIAAKNSRGYGSFKLDGQMRAAHRIVYEMLIGPIARGLELDHHCRIRHCVNPSHLEPISHLENIQRGDAGKYLAARTHCPRGHPYSGYNLGIRKSRGGRYCKECNRLRTQIRRAIK